ncbi:MAG: XRE family transcriptional regulator [Erysipelotrichia bacterium]|nr:XRE family transcriptional regulator [Erysipelotrichia bacterium]
MPDYDIINNLCNELKITLSELMDGEETENNSVRVYDDQQILDLLRRTQELEKQKITMTGVILIIMGVALQALSHTLGGSDVKDFFSGILLGLSIAEMLAGIYVIGKEVIRK